MKKVLIALTLTCLSFGAACAQTNEEILTITPAKKGENTVQVMDALKRDFPNFIVKDVAFLPGQLYDKQWTVTEKNNIDANSDIMYYQVAVSDKGDDYTAFYDKTGKLLNSTETIQNAELPDAVKQTLATQFGDWKMIGDQERITYNRKLSLVYRVDLAKDKSHEKVFIDNAGTVLRRIKQFRL